jgi:cytoskeletal protein CcmA (bactofilin family)
VISGRVSGGIHAVSRLELLATSEVSGEIEAPRMQVEEGAKVQGQVTIGEGVGGGGSRVARPQTVVGRGRAEPEPEAEDLEEAEPEAEDLEEAEPEAEDLEEAEPEAGRLDGVQPEHSPD